MGFECRSSPVELSPITTFDGPNRYLSNLWHSPVALDGSVYMSVEHAYQAARTFDPQAREQIRACTYASQARKIGATAIERVGWPRMRVPLMLDLLRQKFAAGSKLGQRLLTTEGTQLVWENALGDTYWGVCRGAGENKLGDLLMQVRAELELASTDV